MLFVFLCLGYGYLLCSEGELAHWYDAWPLIVLGLLTHYFFGKAAKYRAGLQGEKVSLKYAKKLPDNYFVFTNVTFRLSARRTEIDLVIVGQTGVFVLEVKNHCGHICGDADNDEWTQHLGRGGKCIRPLYNPLRQAKRQAYNLAEALRIQAIGVWVESAVVFANKAATVEVKHRHRAILTAPQQICHFILQNHYAQPLDQAMVEKIAQAIRALQKKAG
jgi:hypothetical protein